MKPVRFVALGDSLTEGVGDRVGDRWRGWAALLAGGLAPAGAVEFHNLAVSGARTCDVLREQTPRALALRPDVVTVVIGVNDTLRRTYDIHAVAVGLSRVYAAFAAQGTALVTACLPDPGAMLRLPGPLARPLARRQRSVNAVVHALSERYQAFHLHLTEQEWITDRAMWSADRLHPGERGHRMLAGRVHRMLADAGVAAGEPPSPEPELPPPSWAAKARWLATKGTAYVLRRSTDLLPQLLALAWQEMRHSAHGTGARLDAQAARTATAALAALATADGPGGAGGQLASAGGRRVASGDAAGSAGPAGGRPELAGGSPAPSGSAGSVRPAAPGAGPFGSRSSDAVPVRPASPGAGSHSVPLSGAEAAEPSLTGAGAVQPALSVAQVGEPSLAAAQAMEPAPSGARAAEPSLTGPETGRTRLSHSGAASSPSAP